MKSFWESDLADSLGMAAIILAVCLGIGGCTVLLSVACKLDKESVEAK